MRGFIEFFRVGKAYDSHSGPTVIVEDFNLDMDRGEYVCLVGHSGCGKSTILTMAAGLNRITTGGIAIDGREIDGPGPDRGIVFQSPCLLPWLTAFENVMLGVRKVYSHGTKQQQRDIASHYLSLVGLGNSRHRRAAELSQGMQQRVAIARAVALRPKMLLLDEPFGMLDSLTRLELQEVLQQVLEKDRITTLMITHDVDEALFMSDRVVMMTMGPRARVGKVLSLPFDRPRRREDVLAHPDYYAFREEMLVFLEEQETERRTAITAAAS